MNNERALKLNKCMVNAVNIMTSQEEKSHQQIYEDSLFLQKTGEFLIYMAENQKKLSEIISAYEEGRK